MKIIAQDAYKMLSKFYEPKLISKRSFLIKIWKFSIKSDISSTENFRFLVFKQLMKGTLHVKQPTSFWKNRSIFRLLLVSIVEPTYTLRVYWVYWHSPAGQFLIERHPKANKNFKESDSESFSTIQRIFSMYT